MQCVDVREVNTHPSGLPIAPDATAVGCRIVRVIDYSSARGWVPSAPSDVLHTSRLATVFADFIFSMAHSWMSRQRQGF
jgi:hypothetical protein